MLFLSSKLSAQERCDNAIAQGSSRVEYSPFYSITRLDLDLDKADNSLPMTWQATAAFLACARIGAVHSAVFAGFSAESLRDRVKDCDCKVVITTEYVFFAVYLGSDIDN